MRLFSVAAVCGLVALISGIMLFAGGSGAREPWLRGLFLISVAGVIGLSIHALVRRLGAMTSRELDDAENDRE